MRHFGIAAALLLTPALPAAAQGVGADRLARFSEQLELLDSRAATQYEYSARLQPGAGGEEEDTAIPRYTGRYAGPWLEVARAAARRLEGLLSRVKGIDGTALTEALQGLAKLRDALDEADRTEKIAS